MLVWPDVTYGRKINWKLTYRSIGSCVCVGYLLTFLILYGSRAAMLPGSWIWEDDWHIWCWSRCGPLWPLSSTHHSPVTSLTSTLPGAFPASAEASLLCGRTLWSCAMCIWFDLIWLWKLLSTVWSCGMCNIFALKIIRTQFALILRPTFCHFPQKARSVVTCVV